MIDFANVFVAIAAFLAGVALLACHLLTRQWRRVVARDAPRAVSVPMTFMAQGVALLPFVFMAGSAARLSVLLGNHGVTAFLTGLAGVLTLHAAWRFGRTALRLRRYFGGAGGIG